MKRSWLGRGLLIIGCLAIVCACMLLSSIPNEDQFLLPCSSCSDDSQSLFLDATNMIQKQGGQVHGAMILSRTQDVSLSTISNQAQITVYAIPAGYFDNRHEALLFGRFITGRDIQSAQRIIMLDEKTVFTLFPGGDAIGKAALLYGEEWTVVGVFREKPRFGETNEAVAYVPLTAAIQVGLVNQTLEIILPDDSSGIQHVMLQDAFTSWCSEGMYYQLSKEKTAAWMPLRWGAVILGCCIIRFLLQLLIMDAKKQYAIYKDKLDKQYVKQFLPWILLRILKLAVYVSLMMVIAYIIMLLVKQSALSFPDWVPEKPVSIASYISRFWTIHGQASRSTQMVSREISVISLSAWLIRWGCMALYAGIIVNMLSKRMAEAKTIH